MAVLDPYMEIYIPAIALLRIYWIDFKKNQWLIYKHFHPAV